VKKKITEATAEMKAEQGKRHAAARARAATCKMEVAAKGTRMCVPMVHLMKKKVTEATAERKVEQAKCHAAALARAEACKMKAAAKGSKMAARKIDEVRKEEEASIAFTREMNEKRHAAAFARSEAFKKGTAEKCGGHVSKVEAVRSDHFLQLDKELEAKMKVHRERQAAVAARAQAIQAEKAEKATRMSSPTKAKSTTQAEPPLGEVMYRGFLVASALAMPLLPPDETDKTSAGGLIVTPIKTTITKSEAEGK